MEFHPEKCQILRITKKQTPILANYNIHNVSLSPVDSAKYLGVNIDCNLNWKTHCNAVCNKANSTLAFLERNLRGCPINIKDKCYKTFVRPTLEYGAISGAIEIPMVDLIPANQNTNIVTRTNTHRLLIPDSRVDSHRYSFFPDTIRLWNHLSQQVKSCDTITGFKNALEKQTLRATYN